MSRQLKGHPFRTERQAGAADRRSVREQLAYDRQIEILDERLGADEGAVKERARLGKEAK